MGDKRVVIAGTSSGVGKTTISLGLMAALSKRGYRVQPYKVGPDYIDPVFHSLVTGKPSHNLDSYFLGYEGVKELYQQNSGEADISIIEGVMGLFDGKGKEGVSSTAEIARILKSPVILIIDGNKLAQSGAALAYGYKNYDPELKVSGVILNNIASKRHYQLIKEAIEDSPVNLEVLGFIPRQKELVLPERHLGLVPTHESRELDRFFMYLIQLIEEYIDLDRIMDLASASEEILFGKRKADNQKKKYDVKIGVAYDQAFNFYYQYNLDLLEDLGASLVYFSPVKDKRLPEVDAIYLGGGFPESFLKELASNLSMKKDIKEKVSSGMPVYAECGGLMYLTENIIDVEGNQYPMVGILPAQTKMESSLQEMGYVEINSIRPNILLNKAEKARGHLFHYSTLINISSTIQHCYKIRDKNERDKNEGYRVYNNLLASYVHLHFASNPVLANNFLKNAEEYR